ncbi:MAG: DUF5615 family PIN-like protein [Armatimonadetes bacterium]|nr:DUF5615 family PIN-like protein [Armatimonadota bacterium]
MRFIIDEDVHECLKFILDEWGQDALHVKLSDALVSLADAELLDYATAQDRVVITYNITDYEALHERCIEDGRSHPGIICCRQLSGYRNFGRMLGWLRTFIAVETSASLRDQLRYLHSQYS